MSRLSREGACPGRAVPSESNPSRHQGKACDGHGLEAVFGRTEDSTGVLCVFTARPQAEVPLGQCHSDF